MPLVSVITPCYNAVEGLPWALASMLAQTYANWELIVVDDGSTDGSAEVVAAVDDPRIRLIRFPENRGRPAARQAGLDAARGDYLAMLDADDWVYPQKLEVQVAAMLEHREVVLVGAGAMIVDRNGVPTGVRSLGPSPGCTVFPPLTKIGSLSMVHAATMIKMQVAKRVRYDDSLPHSQDKDFLLRVILGRRHAMLGKVLYVYTEYHSVTKEKILRSLECNRHVYRKYLRTHPVGSRRQLAAVIAKSAVYRTAFRFGLHETMLRRRSVQPSENQVRDYGRANAKVTELVAGLVGNHPNSN